MDRDHIEIIIGEDYDENLKQTIRSVLKDNNAVCTGGLNNHIDLEILEMSIWNGSLTIEREAMVGIVLVGTREMVYRFISELEKRIELRKKHIIV